MAKAVAIAVAFFAVVAIIAPMPAIAAEDSYYDPDFFETRPGVLFYTFQNDALWEEGILSVRRHATTDCVTPPVALEISFPLLEVETGVVALDIDQALGTAGQPSVIPADAVGVSFFFKGDGSQGSALVELRSDYRQPGAAAEIPLAERKWRHIILTWDKFAPAVEINTVAALAFGLKAGSKRPARYAIDALRFIKTAEPDAALAALADKVNASPAAPVIPQRVSPASCTYNKGGLARARAKLRAGEPMKWLAYGDSVTVPVQMWNVPAALQRRYGYYGAAAGALEREFGCKIDIVVNAVGGRQLSEDFDSLINSLESERPDVLVMLTGDTIENYDRLLPLVQKKAAETGTEILIVVPTYDSAEYISPSIDWLRRWAIDNGVACADARRYLLGVPEYHWGDTIANPAHPNPEGHALIGEVVAEMFR